jgi:hypothetical protein
MTNGQTFRKSLWCSGAPSVKTRSRNAMVAESEGEGESAIAIAALRFIAQTPEYLERFLSLTGMEAQSIRHAAGEPGFLLGVLDYLLGDEPLLLDFAKHFEIDPSAVQVARNVLAHGSEQFP